MCCLGRWVDLGADLCGRVRVEGQAGSLWFAWVWLVVGFVAFGFGLGLIWFNFAWAGLCLVWLGLGWVWLRFGFGWVRWFVYFVRLVVSIVWLLAFPL